MSSASVDKGQLVDFEQHLHGCAPHEAAENVALSFAETQMIGDHKQKFPVNLVGLPGGGKTSLVRSLGQMVNEHMTSEQTEEHGPFTVGVINAKQLYKSDLVGVPVPNAEQTHTEMLSPDLFKTKPQGHGLVLLDEINTEDPDVRLTATELAFSGIHGSNYLEAGYQTVSAMNPNIPSIGLHRSSMGLEEANRFTHVLVNNRPEDFLEYMTMRNADGLDERFKQSADMIIAGMQMKTRECEKPPMDLSLQTFLEKVKPDLVNNPWGRPHTGPVPTPRTWEHVNQSLHVMGRLVDEGVVSSDRGEAILARHVEGTVGRGTAAEFLGFRKSVQDMAFGVDVLDGKMSPEAAKEKIGGDSSKEHAYVTGLVGAVMERTRKGEFTQDTVEGSLIATTAVRADAQAVFMNAVMRNAKSHMGQVPDGEKSKMAAQLLGGFIRAKNSDNPIVKEIVHKQKGILLGAS